MSSERKITLKSSDGETFEVDEAVALESQTIKHMVEDDCADNGIPLPNVTSKILAKVIEYCRKHVEAAKPEERPAVDEDLKAWDAEFVKIDQATLFYLIVMNVVAGGLGLFSPKPGRLQMQSYVIFVIFFCNIISKNNVIEAAATVKLPENVTVPAVIVFGDSIVDTGNNNKNFKTFARCNFLPYGKDLKGGMPTGRYSNGKVPPDLIVEAFGIKELLPAYLDPTPQPNDLLTGVVMAAGGAGYDPLTAKLAAVASLSDQLKQFKEYIEKLKGIVGEEKTNFIIKNSLILVVAGSNDISSTYFLSGVRKLEYDVPSYTDFMLKHASDFVKDLYGLGARRIGVLSAPPIGCVPSQRTINGGIQRDCDERQNQACQLFNSKLSVEMDRLNKNLPNSRVVYIDIYNSLLDLIINPAKYGFEVANKGCCGTGLIEVTKLCNQLQPVCTDDSKYVFWDSYHPTEIAYKIIVKQILDNYSSRFF